MATLNPPSNFKDLSGLRFGNWRVVGGYTTVNKATRWHCRCVCGKEAWIHSYNLIYNRITGCKKCSLRYGKNSTRYKGVGDLSGDYWTSIKGDAAKRGFEFSISLEFCWALFVQQKGLCCKTGRPITLEPSHKRRTHRSTQTASLDRIDSSKGYTEGNVQWVHKEYNVHKLSMTDAAFLKLCKDVVEYDAESKSKFSP